MTQNNLSSSKNRNQFKNTNTSNNKARIDNAIKYVNDCIDPNNPNNPEILSFLQEIYKILSGTNNDVENNEIKILQNIDNILSNLNTPNSKQLMDLILNYKNIKDIIAIYETEELLKVLEEKLDSESGNSIDYQEFINMLNTRLKEIIRIRYDKNLTNLKNTLNKSPNNEMHENNILLFLEALGLDKDSERYKQLYKRFMNLFLYENLRKAWNNIGTNKKLQKISNNITLSNNNQHVMYKGSKLAGIQMNRTSNINVGKERNLYIKTEKYLYDFLHDIYKRLFYIYQKNKNSSNLKTNITIENTYKEIENMFKAYFENKNFNTLTGQQLILKEKYRSAIYGLLDSLSNEGMNKNKIENIRSKIDTVIPPQFV
jgi:hypothetical protein